MLVLRVLPFVLAATLRNRLLHQVRRLRQPRYAFATAVGLAWLWWTVGRGLVTGPRKVPTLSEEFMPAVAVGLAAGGTVMLLLAWIFRVRRQLAMSEAEVQFLFPAPLTRVDVLHWRVLQLLAVGLVGTVFTTLIFGRAASGNPLLFALGWWLAFGVVDMHLLGIALTWAAVGEGWAGLRRRAGTFLLLATAVAFTAWAATRVVPPRPASIEAIPAAAARAVLESPLRYALWPGITLTSLVLARTPAQFLEHLPGALLVLAAHYLWVIRSSVAFEEAVVHAAERRARAREARLRRRGGVPERKGPRKAPFRLSHEGPVEIAFLWKSLIANGVGKLLGRTGVLVALAWAGAMAVLASPLGKVPSTVLGATVATLWVIVVLMGPNVFRTDLRLDRQHLDVLRSLPVAGRRIVRGEILGSLVQVVLAQWLLLGLAGAAFRTPALVGPGVRGWAIAGAAVLGPALSALGLVLHNSVVVVLPGWIPREGERQAGPEASGLRIVVAFGGLLALGLAVLPAAALGGLALGTWAVLAGGPGPPAFALAAWVAAAALLAEAWLATGLLGRMFDRLDPSEG